MAEYDIGDAFREIEHELIDSMTRNLVNHKVEELVEKREWAQWQVMQLEALEEYKRRNAAKFPKRFDDINSRIEQEINTTYNKAQTAQEREILKRIHNGTPAPNAPFTGIQGTFFKVNDRKMNALTDAVTSDMQKAEHAVLRMTNDKYRQIIFNAQVYMNSGAATYKKAVDMATKDFLSAGINCIQYKDGRRVPIDAYAEMALRTANKRAYLQGEGDMRKKWGIHTVILNKRTNACPKCAPFAGKVIVDDVWSGGTAEEAAAKGYLLMSECIKQGLYHPNCKDSHTTYFGDLPNDNDDQAEPEENTSSEIMPAPPGEIVPYSPDNLLQGYTPEEQERNIGLYNAEQRLNHCERQVQRFQRLEEFSFDEGNIRGYTARKSEWKARLVQARKDISDITKMVAISAGSGIIKSIDVDDYELVTYGKGIKPEVSDVIINTMKQCEKDGGFVISEISTEVEPTSEGIPVLQIVPTNYGLLQLNINVKYLSGKSLDEINTAFSNTENNVVNSLKEAVVHESGHAISIKGKMPADVKKLYKELKTKGLPGVSTIALEDGAECLAELEVMRYRKVKVSKELMDFYKKYMGREF